MNEGVQCVCRAVLYEYLLTTITLLGGEGSGGLCPGDTAPATVQTEVMEFLYSLLTAPACYSAQPSG